MVNLKDYSQIIIWGAGHLGTVLGKELIEHGYPLVCYWDLRADNIEMCNGLPVYEPFTQVAEKGDLLVVFGVTSGLIQEASLNKLRQYGCAYIQGMDIYQELICPIDKDHFDITECCGRIECNVDTCSKLNRLIYERYYRQDKILLETGYLFITQRCSLKCKYCIAYMNSYPVEDRIDYSLPRVLKDIDALAESCSYIKRVVVYGGEPLLHPHISDIVEHLLKKDNIGIIDIVSNGIYKQPQSELIKLKSDRVRVEFSNYEEALTSDQIEVRNRNYNELKEIGLNPFLHNVTPEWIKPRTFYNKNLDSEDKARLKKFCDYFVASNDNRIKQSMVIANGRFYPCRMSCSIHTLKVADYPEDYIEIDNYTANEMVDSLESLYRKPFFESCGHCEAKQGEITPIAGEQGFDERYSLKL